MNLVSFPNVSTDADFSQAFVLWKSANDLLVGRKGDPTPAGAVVVNLSGVRLDLMLRTTGSAAGAPLIALSSAASPPTIAIDSGNRGTFTLNFSAASLASALAASPASTSFYHSLVATWIGGKTSNVWTGSMVLLAGPTHT